MKIEFKEYKEPEYLKVHTLTEEEYIEIKERLDKLDIHQVYFLGGAIGLLILNLLILWRL